MASVFFLLVISKLLLTTSSTFIADLVTSTCSQTPFVNVCLSSLRSDPRSATSDVKGLATIALDQTIANANHTKSHVLNLIKSHNPPNQTEYEYKCLKACLVEYLEGLDNLQASSVALVRDNLYTVNSRVSAAMTDAQTCEDGYLDEDLEENTSPLTVRNQLFSELASNFLAIVRLLK